MNFFQLECFVLAVEKKSFAEVASTMHVTQPTITYQITNLEEELEEKLFLRTKRGVEATREGLLFYENAKDILKAYHHAIDHFKHAVSMKDSVIRLGFTRSPDNYDIFSAVHSFRAAYPDTVVDVIQDKLAEDVPDHTADRFDVLLHYRYEENSFSDWEYVRLGSCPYYVLLSQSSPLAERDSLTLEELKGNRLLVIEEYKNCLFQVPSLEEAKKAGIEVLSYENLNQMMYAIADRIGFGIYPAKYKEVKAGFKRVLLTSLPPLEYGFLYHKEHSAEVETFLQYLVEKLTENQKL